MGVSNSAYGNLANTSVSSVPMMISGDVDSSKISNSGTLFLTD
jgi:hypothetical protein